MSAECACDLASRADLGQPLRAGLFGRGKSGNIVKRSPRGLAGEHPPGSGFRICGTRRAQQNLCRRRRPQKSLLAWHPATIRAWRSCWVRNFDTPVAVGAWARLSPHRPV
jgi:hypothetical protein